MKRVAVLILVFINIYVSAQESAPTLSMGIDKVLFSKGGLDVGLISEIIASKQDELKKTIVKKEILRRVNQEGCFATRNYAYNVVDVILNERNKGVLKREILEYTANYAFVYGISELYLRLACESDQTLLSSVIKDFGYPNADSLYKHTNNRPLGLFLERINRPIDLGQSDQLSLSNIMLDIVFDVSQNNEMLKGKGFFQKPLYLTWSEYELENSYYWYLNHVKDQGKEARIQALKKDINGFISQILKFYNIIGKVDGVEHLDTLRNRLTVQIDQNTAHLEQHLFADAIVIQNELFQKQKKSLKEGENIDLVIERLRADVSERAKKAVDFDLATIKSYREDSIALIDLFRDYNDFCDEIKVCTGSFVRGDQSTTHFLETEKLRSAANGGSVSNRSYIDTLDRLIARDRVITSEFARITGINPKFEKDLAKPIEVAFNKRDDKLKDFNEYEVAKNLLAESYRSSDKVAQAISQLERELDVQEKEVAEHSSLIATNLSENVRYLNTQLEAITMMDLKLSPENDSVLLELYRQLYVLKSANHSFANYHYITYLRKDLLPDVRLLNQHQGGKFNMVIRLVENITYLIEKEIFSPFKKSTEVGENSLLFVLLQKGDEINFDYVNFLEKLDHLEEVGTYSYLLHTLLGIGDIHAKKGTSRALNTVVNAIEKYIEFDVADDQIELDVEGIILALYDQYADRDFNGMKFHLTVGLNQATFLTQGYSLNATDTISNLAFASEKIGVKFKLVNWKLRRSYLPGENFKNKVVTERKASRHFQSDPIISDLHILLYGSGLLHNLSNLTSNKEFNHPIAGLSLGISTYNHLDFNIGLAMPLASNRTLSTNDLMLNVGFDIRFSEYLTALNKKRKQEKAEKLRTERAPERLPVSR
ncbi:MAG: hypothetical protein JKY54_08995 [Flavobacteriales bacterium]|nr:hypothetical protein [Flavobacteriales bacterium]